MRYRPVEGKSRNYVSLCGIKVLRLTVMKVSRIAIRIPSHSHVYQPPTWHQSALEIVVSYYGIFWIRMMTIVDQDALPVFDATTTSESTPIAKNLQEEIMSQVIELGISHSNLTGEHGGEFGVKLDELSSDRYTFFSKRSQHIIST